MKSIEDLPEIPPAPPGSRRTNCLRWDPTYAGPLLMQAWVLADGTVEWRRVGLGLIDDADVIASLS